jgi:hypothetical protein
MRRLIVQENAKALLKKNCYVINQSDKNRCPWEDIIVQEKCNSILKKMTRITFFIIRFGIYINVLSIKMHLNVF